MVAILKNKERGTGDGNGERGTGTGESLKAGVFKTGNHRTWFRHLRSSEPNVLTKRYP